LNEYPTTIERIQHQRTWGFSSKSSETQNIEAENSKEGVGLNRNCFHMWSKIIVEMRRKMMGLMEMLAKIMEDYKF
jgi:hypothetical protein